MPMQLAWATPDQVPAGFVYCPDFVTEAEEHDLVEAIRGVEFSEVKMRGAVARRRTAHFGWLYVYERWRIEQGPQIPDFLLPLRERVGKLADVAAEELVEVLLTEYSLGAAIGWHRDAPMFGVVAGVSLLGACRFRFDRGRSDARETRAITLVPRSAYLLTGEARTAWRHSIPQTKERRYSVTFRTLVPANDSISSRRLRTSPHEGLRL